MTIYCPIDELPRDKLAGLAGDAVFEISTSHGKITSYRYVWPDLKIQINVRRGAEIESHLDAFVGFAEMIASRKGVPLESIVVDRIR